MSKYVIRPTYPLAAGKLQAGYAALAQNIRASAARIWMIDGASGNDWKKIQGELEAQLANSHALFIDMRGACGEPHRLEALLAPYLDATDPNTGKLYPGSIADFFDPARLEKISADAQQAAKGAKTVICLGPGSALLPLEGKRVWVNILREHMQQPGRLQHIRSLAPDRYPLTQGLQFVDWPVLDRHRDALLQRLDLYVDHADVDTPVLIEGSALRANLTALSQRPFRARTIFYPSAWGGRWILNNIRPAADLPNVGWAFALVPEESGVLLGDGGLELEVPFDLILAQETVNVQGTAVAKEFGGNFPVRFNLTDTIGGSDLSVQVHPTAENAQSDFGTTFTENETYYVFHSEGGRVYLGFKESVDPQAFRRAVERARDEHVPLDVHAHINSYPTRPHDMFQIQAGTVHFIGANNLLLEIVSAHTIHTYRVYDHLRRTKDGSMRPVHIEKAFENLDFSRTTAWVEENLLERPALLAESQGWEEYLAANRPWTAYAVNRIEFEREYIGHTDLERFHVLTMVEGEEIIVEGGGYSHPLHYLETMLVPAATGAYRLVNSDSKPAKVIKTYIKADQGPASATSA